MVENVKNLKKHYEEKISLLTERYNEILKAFETRPSRVEDLALIKQLQGEGGADKSGEGKASDTPKGYIIDLPKKDPNTSKLFHSQSYINGNPSVSSVDKIKVKPILLNKFNLQKRPVKNMSPSNVSTVLPPISISQFTIQVRSPPQGGLLSTKKFFK